MRNIPDFTVLGLAAHVDGILAFHLKGTAVNPVSSSFLPAVFDWTVQTAPCHARERRSRADLNNVARYLGDNWTLVDYLRMKIAITDPTMHATATTTNTTDVSPLTSMTRPMNGSPKPAKR